MIAAGKVLLWSVKRIYDEMLLLLKANLVWLLVSAVLGCPLTLILVAALPPMTTETGSPDLIVPLTLAGFLLLIVPNPASIGLHRVAARMILKDSPPWSEFWGGFIHNLGLGLLLYVVGMTGVVVLGVNTVFYWRTYDGPIQALSILWLYLGLYWLAIQLYLGPLIVLMDERRPLALYRRAAALVLAQPIYTLVLLFAVTLLIVLSILVPPLYPAIGMAFVALATTRALGELRRKYDPASSSDEETA
jgi:uncharacterized membrane protein YesL